MQSQVRTGLHVTGLQLLAHQRPRPLELLDASMWMPSFFSMRLIAAQRAAISATPSATSGGGGTEGAMNIGLLLVFFTFNVLAFARSADIFSLASAAGFVPSVSLSSIVLTTRLIDFSLKQTHKQMHK